MMNRYGVCQAPGCERAAHGWGRFCSKHRDRQAERGHFAQQMIKGPNLTAWKRRIVKVKKGHPEWDLAWRWTAIVNHAHAMDNGHILPGSEHDRRASRYIVQIAKNVSSAEAVENTMLALAAMSVAAPPGTIRDKKALKFQMAKGLMRLTRVANFQRPKVPVSPAVRASRWDHEGQRQVVKYRHLEPQCLEIIGGHLCRMYGELGELIGQMWRAEDHVKQKLRWMGGSPAGRSSEDSPTASQG